MLCSFFTLSLLRCSLCENVPAHSFLTEGARPCPPQAPCQQAVHTSGGQTSYTASRSSGIRKCDDPLPRPGRFPNWLPSLRQFISLLSLFLFSPENKGCWKWMTSWLFLDTHYDSPLCLLCLSRGVSIPIPANIRLQISLSPLGELDPKIVPSFWYLLLLVLYWSYLRVLIECSFSPLRWNFVESVSHVASV